MIVAPFFQKVSLCSLDFGGEDRFSFFLDAHARDDLEHRRNLGEAAGLAGGEARRHDAVDGKSQGGKQRTHEREVESEKDTLGQVLAESRDGTKDPGVAERPSPRVTRQENDSAADDQHVEEHPDLAGAVDVSRRLLVAAYELLLQSRRLLVAQRAYYY